MARSNIVALYGPARSGKDTFAKPFIQSGYVPLSPGRYIKDFFYEYLTGMIGASELYHDIKRASKATPDTIQAFFEAHLYPFDDLNECIDPFTDVSEDKQKIRPILEYGGELIYGHILRQFFEAVDRCTLGGHSVINTRVGQTPEARGLVERGAQFIYVSRPGVIAASDWETRSICQIDDVLEGAGIAPAHVCNDGTPEELQARARELMEALDDE